MTIRLNPHTLQVVKHNTSDTRPPIQQQQHPRFHNRLKQLAPLLSAYLFMCLLSPIGAATQTETPQAVLDRWLAMKQMEAFKEVRTFQIDTVDNDAFVDELIKRAFDPETTGRKAHSQLVHVVASGIFKHGSMRRSLDRHRDTILSTAKAWVVRPEDHTLLKNFQWKLMRRQAALTLAGHLRWERQQDLEQFITVLTDGMTDIMASMQVQAAVPSLLSDRREWSQEFLNYLRSTMLTSDSFFQAAAIYTPYQMVIKRGTLDAELFLTLNKRFQNHANYDTLISLMLSAVKDEDVQEANEISQALIGLLQDPKTESYRKCKVAILLSKAAPAESKQAIQQALADPALSETWRTMFVKSLNKKGLQDWIPKDVQESSKADQDKAASKQTDTSKGQPDVVIDPNTPTGLVHRMLTEKTYRYPDERHTKVLDGLDQNAVDQVVDGLLASIMRKDNSTASQTVRAGSWMDLLAKKSAMVRKSMDRYGDTYRQQLEKIFDADDTRSLRYSKYTQRNRLITALSWCETIKKEEDSKLVIHHLDAIEHSLSMSAIGRLAKRLHPWPAPLLSKWQQTLEQCIASDNERQMRGLLGIWLKHITFTDAQVATILKWAKQDSLKKKLRFGLIITLLKKDKLPLAGNEDWFYTLCQEPEFLGYERARLLRFLYTKDKDRAMQALSELVLEKDLYGYSVSYAFRSMLALDPKHKLIAATEQKANESGLSRNIASAYKDKARGEPLDRE